MGENEVIGIEEVSTSDTQRRTTVTCISNSGIVFFMKKDDFVKSVNLYKFSDQVLSERFLKQQIMDKRLDETETFLKSDLVQHSLPISTIRSSIVNSPQPHDINQAIKSKSVGKITINLSTLLKSKKWLILKSCNRGTQQELDYSSESRRESPQTVKYPENYRPEPITEKKYLVIETTQ